jgi:O-antigen ligase
VNGVTRQTLFLRLSLTCCGLAVSVPFLNPYHYYPLLIFYTEWLAFVSGLLALAAAAMAGSRNPIPIPGMCFGLFLIASLLVLQAALGWVAYPVRSAVGALYLIWAALLVLLGAWLASELGETGVSHALQWWIALGGALAAASGFVQYYELPLPTGVYATLDPINQMFGTVNQKNSFADYLGCALVSVTFLHARKSLGVLLTLVLTLLLAAGMALSFSRGAWAYMGIGFALALLLRGGGRPEEAKGVLRVASLAFAIFLLVQVLNSYTEIFAGPLGKPLSSGERLVDLRAMEFGGSARSQLSLYAWLMFLSHPFLGVGFGEFAWNAFQLAADLPGFVPPGLDQHAHNLPLQLLAETGIAGLLCFVVPLALWLWRTPWRALSPERCWAIGVLAVIGVHSMLEFPLWHASFLGVFALLFGAASPASTAIEPTRLRRSVLAVIVLAGGLAALGAWSDHRALERWYLALEEKGARGEILTRGDLEELLRLRENSLFGPYFERAATETIALDGRELGDKLALNTQVMRAYPTPSVALRQVALLAMSGRDYEAARILRGAARVYPEWVRRWLPELEELARGRPERFSALLALARAQLAEAGP